MNIKKYNATKNTTYRQNRRISYIVIHGTSGISSKNGSALGNCNWFKNGGRSASADFVVDDVDIYQYSADIKNRYTWHCGDTQKGKTGVYKGYCTNANSIGIELCTTNKKGKVTNVDDGNWYFTDKVLTNAIELVKQLMKEYNIPVTNVIRHRDVTGKNCPVSNGWFGDNSEWIWFKSQLSSNSTLTTKSDDGYIVEVKSPDGELNLREEPNANSKVIQILKNGDRVKIVGQKGDWLQTNWNRWLNGKYTKVVK